MAKYNEIQTLTLKDESGTFSKTYDSFPDKTAREKLKNVVTNVNGKTGVVSLSASDVGALPDTYTPPDQTAQQVGADPAGTAAGAVSTHNTNTASHEDIRLLISGLTTRLNALANSTDEDLDQMAELVAYIKSNKSLIDTITTSKVSVADIVNNLTTNVSNKPLSAAQGVALKSLIDALSTGKLDASALTEAINAALAQAKDTGEFDGADGAPGQRGTGILTVSTSPASYTTATAGKTPTHRMQLATVKSQAGVDYVLVGDWILNGNKLYHIYYLATDYVYIDISKDIKGGSGTSVKINSITESDASGGENVVNFSDGKTLTVKNGNDGNDYVLTDADKEEIARKVPNVTTPAAPLFVSGESEMTDTGRVYVNTETGTVWRYQEATVTRKVRIDCDAGYSYPENSRLGSGAPVTSGSYAGYTVTPFIDLLAYPAPFTLHLDGAAFLVPALDSYTRVALYKADQTLIAEEKHPYTSYDDLFNVTDADVSVDSGGNGTITFRSTPAAASGAALRYIRISGKVFGTPHVYVTYDETVSGTFWVDTGIVYAPNITEAEKQQIADDIIARIDTALLSVVGSGEVV